MWVFLQRVVTVVDDTLSIGLLLRNFGAPWRGSKNIFGWIFGIGVKLVYLPIALGILLLVAGVLFLIAILWGILPPTTVYFIIISFF